MEPPYRVEWEPAGPAESERPPRRPGMFTERSEVFSEQRVNSLAHEHAGPGMDP